MPRVTPHPDKDGFLIIGDKEYATVAKRIEAFRKDYPVSAGYAIRSELIENDDYVHWRCDVVHPEGYIVATGNKRIRNGQHKLEACQTGAVGRALGFAGYACGEVASAEDMLEFYNGEEELAPAPAPDMPPYMESVWDNHTTAEVEAFFKKTEGLNMKAKDHEVLTASINRPPPWEMNVATRMAYVDWLLSEDGQRKLECIK